MDLFVLCVACFDSVYELFKPRKIDVYVWINIIFLLLYIKVLYLSNHAHQNVDTIYKPVGFKTANGVATILTDSARRNECFNAITSAKLN